MGPAKRVRRVTIVEPKKSRVAKRKTAPKKLKRGRRSRSKTLATKSKSKSTTVSAKRKQRSSSVGFEKTLGSGNYGDVVLIPSPEGVKNHPIVARKSFKEGET